MLFALMLCLKFAFISSSYADGTDLKKINLFHIDTKLVPDLRPPFVIPVPPPTVNFDDAEWRLQFQETLAEILKQFLDGFIPDPSGADHPNPYEYAIDQFVKYLGMSHMKLLLQGVGNVHWIQADYLYNEIQAGIGFEYDFISPQLPGTLLAIRVAPVHIEVAWIRMASGALPTENLPLQVLVGSSAGFEAAKNFGAFEPGVRSYVTPQVDPLTLRTGVEFFEALYCKIHLEKLFHLSPSPEFWFTPMIAYYDRGAAKEPELGWKGPTTAPVLIDDAIQTNLKRMSRFWEVTALLGVKF